MPFRINNKWFSKTHLLESCRLNLKSNCADWEKDIYQFILSWFNSDSYIIVQSSGSTGKRKTISLEKEEMEKVAQLTGVFFSLRPHQTILLCLPAKYIAGKMMIVRSFVLNLHLIFIKPSANPLEKINTIIDFSAITPYQAYHSLNALRKIKILLIGGGTIHPNLEKKIAKINKNSYHTYGMTETSGHIALRQITLKDTESYFTALPNITFSKDNRECLVIEAPYLLKKKIVTNDIIYLHKKNKFKWIARYDFVINSGGIKIIPEQIEKSIGYLLPNNFFLFSKKDISIGEKLVLLIEGEIVFSSIKPLKRTIREMFSSYHVPKEIISLPRFVYTETQKIDRKKTIASLNI